MVRAALASGWPSVPALCQTRSATETASEYSRLKVAMSALAASTRCEIETRPTRICVKDGNAGASPSGVGSSVVTSSTSAAISSVVTPRSIVTRSMPRCVRRRTSPPSPSAFAIGVSSTMISSLTMPTTIEGSTEWSS